MKKSLLLAAALSVAVVASAQVANHAGKVQANAAPAQMMKNAKIEKRVGTHATTAVSKAAAPKRVVPANTAYYLRPKGTMYCNWDKNGSGFVMPFVYTKPYDTVTWRNMSTAQGAPSWGYWLYSVDNGQRDSLISTDQDLTVRYGYEYEDAPYLTVGSSVYTLSGYRVNRTTGAIESTATSGVASVPNSMEIYSSFETNMLSSAHYYGSSNRFGQEMYGWTYYSGAQGPDGDEDNSGFWFGKNYSGWNVYGCGFEKPTSPYVLNKIYMWVTSLAVTEDVDLEARVYRLADLPAYNDTASAGIDPALLNEENLIATGRTTITTDMNADGSPILEFTLYETDPELGIEYETTPEINDAIVIAIVGMDDERIQTISALVTTDEEDEGVGEVTFLGHQEDGTILTLTGLNNFFTSGEFKAGSSILIDVTRPFITYNYTFETGEYTFPNAGGKLEYPDYGLEGISFFATSPKADWMVTTLDGNDVPDWLTITLEDDMEDGEWSGTVNANVTAAALPADLTGRTAVVRFAINGGYVDYKFIQGDGGDEPQPHQGIVGDINDDGQVDVSDVNIAIDIVLGKDSNDNYDGRADLTGDGQVDVSDVNAVIDIVLGKV